MECNGLLRSSKISRKGWLKTLFEVDQIKTKALWTSVRILQSDDSNSIDSVSEKCVLILVP